MNHQDIFYNVQQEESSCGSNSLDGGGSSPSSGGPSGTVHLGTRREEYLPRDKVVRIMEQVLPPNAAISNDAKGAMQKYASEFASVVTSEANKRCKRERRKVIAVEDLMSAMEGLGLNNYADVLVAYYDRYLQNDAEKSMPAPAAPPQSAPFNGYGFHVGEPTSDSAIYAPAPAPAPAPLQSVPFNGYGFHVGEPNSDGAMYERL